MKILILILIILIFMLFCICIERVIYEAKVKTILKQYNLYETSDDFLDALLNVAYSEEELYEIGYKANKIDEMQKEEDSEDDRE